MNGGASGDGTGTPNGLSPKLMVKPDGCTVTSWDSRWTGDPATDDAVSGKGDPCRYYLKGTWHLPTKDEYAALFNQTAFSSTSTPWKWVDSPASAIHTSGLTFPASGRRSNSGGSLELAGTYGFYWTSMAITASTDSGVYTLSFKNSQMRPNETYTRIHGHSVRCVQNASN